MARNDLQIMTTVELAAAYGIPVRTIRDRIRKAQQKCLDINYGYNDKRQRAYYVTDVFVDAVLRGQRKSMPKPAKRGQEPAELSIRATGISGEAKGDDVAVTVTFAKEQVRKFAAFIRSFGYK